MGIQNVVRLPQSSFKGHEVVPNFTSDGSLSQLGIILINKEFENGLFLVCVLPLFLLSGLPPN